MEQQARITYLLNSGFLVELGGAALVFDYYQDPAKNVQPVLMDAAVPMYIFSSHAHHDHFNPAIRAFAKQTQRYFFSFDIQAHPAARQIPADQVTYLQAYDAYESEAIRVRTYSSTDEGISFLVEIGGWKIFHAGDFNWWHWKGDSKENNLFARNGFMKQMKRLDGLQADVAFFPVDSRLEEFMDIGVKEFCRRTEIQHLITMHNVNGDLWTPSADFFAEGRQIPVWSPLRSGETIKIHKSEE